MKLQRLLILIIFLVSCVGPLPEAQSQPVSLAGGEFRLPKPGVMVHLSPPMNPPMLKGIKVHPENPFRFDFILDKGDELMSSLPRRQAGPNALIGDPGKSELGSRLKHSGTTDQQLKDEANRLIKYFLASITVPEKDLWVNLSPYEKDRIISNSFGQTEMGRDLLTEDYMLKQITASLIYPEDEVGKKFWKRIYEESQAKYGTTNIPVNTFNKVWIVPEKAVVYENAKAGTAYVVESRLKVMLEGDYLAMDKNTKPLSSLPRRQAGPNVSVGDLEHAGSRFPIKAFGNDKEGVNQIGSKIIREIVIPELTREINEGANFAKLRQVYNSLILATWYKKKIKDSILSQVYADKNKVQGLSSPKSFIGDPGSSELGPRRKHSGTTNDVETIYQRYLQAFKKGVYNYIKEDLDPTTNQPMSKKYFSGGATFLGLGDSAMVTTNQLPNKMVDSAVVVSVRVDQAMQAVVSTGDLGGNIEEFEPIPGMQFSIYSGEKVIKSDYYTNALLSQATAIRRRFLERGKEVKMAADFGTGRGTLAIFEGKLFPNARIVAVDLNNEAVQLAQSNALVNGISERFEARQGEASEALRTEDKFDCVMFTLPTSVVDPKSIQQMFQYQRSFLDGGWNGRKNVDKIIRTINPNISMGGAMYFMISSFIGIQKTLDILKENGFEGKVFYSQRKYLDETISTLAMSEYIERELGYKFPEDNRRKYFELILIEAIKVKNVISGDNAQLSLKLSGRKFEIKGKFYTLRLPVEIVDYLGINLDKVRKVIDGDLAPDYTYGRRSYIKLDADPTREDLQGKILVLKGYSSKIHKLISGKERPVEHVGKGKVSSIVLVDPLGRRYKFSDFSSHIEGTLDLSNANRENVLNERLFLNDSDLSVIPAGTIEFNMPSKSLVQRRLGVVMMIIDDIHDVRVGQMVDELVQAKFGSDHNDFDLEKDRNLAKSIRKFVFESAEALRRLHEQGVIHRFFHLGNVSVSKSNQTIQIRDLDGAVYFGNGIYTQRQFVEWALLDVEYFISKIRQQFLYKSELLKSVLGEDWEKELLVAYLGGKDHMTNDMIKLDQAEYLTPDLVRQILTIEHQEMVRRLTMKWALPSLYAMKKSLTVSGFFKDPQKIAGRFLKPVIPMTKNQLTLSSQDQLIYKGEYQSVVDIYEQSGKAIPSDDRDLYNLVICLIVVRKDEEAKRLYNTYNSRIRSFEETILSVKFERLNDINVGLKEIFSQQGSLDEAIVGDEKEIFGDNDQSARPDQAMISINNLFSQLIEKTHQFRKIQNEAKRNIEQGKYVTAEQHQAMDDLRISMVIISQDILKWRREKFAKTDKVVVKVTTSDGEKIEYPVHYLDFSFFKYPLDVRSLTAEEKEKKGLKTLDLDALLPSEDELLESIGMSLAPESDPLKPGYKKYSQRLEQEIKDTLIGGLISSDLDLPDKDRVKFLQILPILYELGYGIGYLHKKIETDADGKLNIQGMLFISPRDSFLQPLFTGVNYAPMESISFWVNGNKETEINSSVDGAMKAERGGIDFTANKTPIEVQNSGESIKFNIDPAMLQQLQNAPGFYPVIINIKPMTDLRSFLGLNSQEKVLVSNS